MAFFLAPEVIEAILEVGVTAAAVGAVAIGTVEIAHELAKLDVAKDVAQATTDLHNWANTITSSLVSADGFVQVQLINALSDAYHRGELIPSETSAALAWILKVDKLTALSGAYVSEGQFAAALALWSVHQGHTITDVATQPVVKTPAVIYTGTTGEGANTAGGQIVAGAQASVVPELVKVPGISASTAAGISTALGETYKNAMTTMVGVAEALQSQIRQVGDLTASAQGTADQAYKEVTGLIADLKATVTILNKDITGIGDAVNTLNVKVATQAKTIDNLTHQIDSYAPPGTTSPTSPLDVAGIEGVVAGMGLATLAGLDSLGYAVDAIGTEAATSATELTSIGAGLATMTLEDLEACCEGNSAVTGAITGGGATAALLGSLGPLLLEAAVIATGVGIIGVVQTILDLPAAIAGGVKGAKFAATHVDAIVASTVTLIEDGGLIADLAS